MARIETQSTMIKSKAWFIENGTNEYCSPKYSVEQYKNGNCPMNDVEASISSAMESYHSQFLSQGLREEERNLLEKAHDITIDQLMQTQQERNKWKEMCLQLAEEMRRAEWVSPLYDKVQELVKPQTPTPDGSQGFREANLEIVRLKLLIKMMWMKEINPGSDWNQFKREHDLATEALKNSEPDYKIIGTENKFGEHNVEIIPKRE